MDVEQRAKELGWHPLEGFKGDPAKWVDAETFVQRGEELMPILKANNAKLTGTVEDLRGKVTSLQQTVLDAQAALTEFRKYHEATALREYERALETLKTERKEARKEGDDDRVEELTEAIDTLRDSAPKPVAAAPTPPAPPTAPAIHPDYKQWEEDNAVWLADPEKRAYSQGVATYLRAAGRPESGRAFLDLITKEVEAKFGGRASDKFVEGGDSTARSGSGRSYNDLPPDAKAACDRFGQRFVGKGKAYETLADWRKQYAKDYDWS